MSENRGINIRVEGTEKAASGIGAFFFSLILVSVAVSLLAGLGFATGIIQLKHTEKQYTREETTKDRMDGRVGVTQPLKAPVKLIILPRHGCVQIEQAFLDSGHLTVYFRSHCSVFMNYYQFHLSERSPDGTVVASDYENTSVLPQLSPGDKAEWSKDLSGDDRVSSVQVWTADQQ